MKSRGFTLIEILVTVTIIAVLTAVGVVSYGSVNKNSRDAKRKSDIEQIRQALEMYKADMGYYPPCGGYCQAISLASALVTRGYMSAIPTDPLAGQANQGYYYLPTNSDGTFYYGYCLSANLEGQNPVDTCTPYAGQNYGVKNP